MALRTALERSAGFETAAIVQRVRSASPAGSDGRPGAGPLSVGADAVLLVHFAFVLFVVSLFVLVPVGAALGWRWVRWRPLRWAHLIAIAFVAAETAAGIACPLTVWEDVLRGKTGAVPFIPRLVRSVLFYDLPAWIFTTVYLAAAGLAVGLWRLVPPRRACKR